MAEGKTQLDLLHPEYFDGPFLADDMQFALQDRILDFQRRWEADECKPFTDVTVALHSFNDTPEMLHRAFKGIRNQELVEDVEVLFVDAGMRDARTNDTGRWIAKVYGASVVEAEVNSSFRADILNRGLDAASNDHVFMMPAHGVMASNVTLAAARLHMKANRADELKVGGVYGVIIPDFGASGPEWYGAHFMGAAKRLSRPAAPGTPGAGFLDGSCSMVSKRAVHLVSPEGYPPDFGYGGADGALGKRMQRGIFHTHKPDGEELPFALQLDVIEDGALAVHHTHGFNIRDSLRQYAAWMRMGKPRDFDPAQWQWHPHLGL